VLVSAKSPPGMEVVVAGTAGATVVFGASGVELAAWTTGAVVDNVCGAAELATATAPDEPKLLEAVVDAPLLTVTLFTITTSPSVLVILTSTVVVPKPEAFWKKLYDCRVVDWYVLPPSVLTSRLSTALLALTTCMLNQKAETPSLLWSSRGEVMGQSTKSQVVSIIPVVGLASAAKASGKRSRWFSPQPGHWSTIYSHVSRSS